MPLHHHTGSLSIERIQNLMYGRHAALCNRTVGPKRQSWLAFIRRHPEHFVVVEDTGRTTHRVSWVGYPQWRLADARRRIDLRNARACWVHSLRTYLEGCSGRACPIDEFLAHCPADMPSLVGGHCSRGDVVRLVCRHPELFSFDRAMYTVAML